MPSDEERRREAVLRLLAAPAAAFVNTVESEGTLDNAGAQAIAVRLGFDVLQVGQRAAAEQDAIVERETPEIVAGGVPEDRARELANALARAAVALGISAGSRAGG
jgi:hypothetical protein